MPAITRSLAALCASAAASTALTGCLGDGTDGGAAVPLAAPAASTSAAATGGPQPYADLTARQLLDKAVADMRAAGALTVDMSGEYDDSLMHAKAAVTTSGTCAASVDADGETLQLIVTGHGTPYVKGDDSFWYDNAGDSGDGGDATVDRLAGKWARMTRAELAELGLDRLCELDKFLDDSMADIGRGTLRKEAQVTLGGRQVVPLVHTVAGQRSTIYVSTGATPYVVKSVESEDGSSETDLYTGFGAAPHVSAPPTTLTVQPRDLGGGPDGGTFHV